MPTYDLKCRACGHQFQDTHTMSEPHCDCPQCSTSKPEVLFKTAPAYHNHYSPLHPRRNRGRGF